MAADVGSPVPTASRLSADARFMPGQRVLVIEDHPTNQALMHWRLRQLGLDFVIAPEGAAALAALETQAFDVVITDCRMPGMNGYAFTEALREQERARGSARLPVIALTANAGADEQARCHRAGIDAVLTKPVSLEQLCVALEHWLVVSAVPDQKGHEEAGIPDDLEGDWTRDLPTPDALEARFGSTEVARQIAASLDDALGDDIDTLTAALANGDAEQAHDALHRMAGGAGAVGTTHLAHHLRDLSVAVKRDGIVRQQGALAHVQAVVAAYRAVVASIR
jgi:two-component system sensor histidine kinase EvgS